MNAGNGTLRCLARHCLTTMHTPARHICIGLLSMAAVLQPLTVLAHTAPPQTVYFPASDGKTELVGYLFSPAGSGPHPAIVMLHGRAGPYSANVNAGCSLVGRVQVSACNAASLSKRHMMWGQYWAQHGYLALHVDSFGPRGRAHGYGRGTHDDPDRNAVNERTVRPLDAQAALVYLARRSDVLPNRIMLQGWSNGGSTALNVMYRQAVHAAAGKTPVFRAALVFYPGCGRHALLSQRYQAEGRIWVFLGSADAEVSPLICRSVLSKASAAPDQINLRWYDGATHDFDDPGHQHQALDANRTAKDDVMQRAAGLLDGIAP